MNINYPLKATALLMLLCAAISVSAQSKKAVILINSVPYNVVLSADGEITEIKGEAKGYMKGFIRSADEFDFPMDKKVIVASTIPEGSSVRSDRNFIDFETNYATLTNQATIALDKVVASFSMASGEKILITAFKASEGEDDTLATNRLATCKTYLELKGVPVDRILTEIAASSALKDKLSLSYIQ